MDIINRIDNFAVDIYFKLTEELNNDYIEICEMTAAFFDNNFSTVNEIVEEKANLIEYLFNIFKSNDYIKMADALCYTVKPILLEAIPVVTRMN